MEKSALKHVIMDQKESFVKEFKLVERQVNGNIINSNKIIVITGIRRSGKSTLLKQLSKNYKSFGYINFEDDRLISFTHEDFQPLLESFLEIDNEIRTFFFDEIQNISGWEKFARRLFTDEYKLFVTGSNAKLLSSDIATSLTGRNLKIELYPFSFREYLDYHNVQLKKAYTTKEKIHMSKHLQDYLHYGGFPEIVKSRDLEELKEIYQDILIKDLIVRFKIRDTKEFRELALYLLSNISRKISYNSLKNLLSFSNTSKVKNYVEFMVQAYIFFTISKYDFSIKKQIINEKKIYAIDTGIVKAASFQFSEAKGRILENAVFLEMKRKGEEIYRYEEKNECDFVTREGTKIKKAIQVAASLADPETKKREIAGLCEAMDKFNLQEGTIITEDFETDLTQGNKKIKIIPLNKFLLEDN